MLPIDPRKEKILSAIIQHFINTAEPVGSQTILVKYQLSVSPATIRNDMAYLENEGLIYQPHTSAGRIPTAAGYKMYIEKLADYKKAEKLAKANIEKLKMAIAKKRAEQRVYEAVALLSHAVPNVSFASIPENNRTFFLGISNLLKQPEFQEQPNQASQVIEVLEEGSHFLDTLNKLGLDDEPHIFIGQDNLLPEIESCSLIVTRYRFEDHDGFLGLLGPIRMPYAYNLATLKEVKSLLENSPNPLM